MKEQLETNKSSVLLQTNNSNLIFTKVRDVRSPQRAHPQDAGIDLYVPQINDQFIYDTKKLNEVTNSDISSFYISNIEGKPTIVLYPNKRMSIPMGIKIKNNISGTALFAKNKSGIASKQGLIKLAQVIDENYLGEIFVSIYNTNNSNYVYINEDTKLIQLVQVPIIYSTISEISNDEFEKFNSDRGDGCLGSTGK